MCEITKHIHYICINTLILICKWCLFLNRIVHLSAQIDNVIVMVYIGKKLYIAINYQHIINTKSTMKLIISNSCLKSFVI